jgi:N-acetylglucosamine-6-sulfatase
VLNVDLAPTFASLAGVASPGAEGNSLVPLLDGTVGSWRSDVLIEHATNSKSQGAVPPFCALRNKSYEYVRYATGEEELYNMTSDPFQLENRASDPGLAAIKTAMRSRVSELCDPPPPGYSP